MQFQQILDKALEVRKKYEDFEIRKVGHTWSNREIMEGLVGDIGDLMKLVMAKEGSRQIEDVDDNLAHELSDCLWCILVLSKKYNIDLENEFLAKMDELSTRIAG